MFGFEPIDGVRITGAPLFPEFRIDYDSFSFMVFLCSAACGCLIPVGLLHAYLMKPATGIAYAIGVVTTVVLMSGVMSMTLTHKEHLLGND